MVATRLARMLLLETLLSSANTIHAIKTAPNPARKACPDVFPIKKAAKNAISADIHHGKKKLLINDKRRMIKKSIFASFPNFLCQQR